MNEEIVQYLIFNQDLKMSKGKCVAQGCHVVGMICNDMVGEYCNDGLIGRFTSKQVSDYLDWYQGSMTKITLKAPQYYLEHLTSLDDPRIYHIRDEGRTQIEPDSLTCVALIPMTREEAKQFVGNLKLL